MHTRTHINKFTFMPTDCALCGASDSRERYQITKYAQGALRFVTCCACGTIYQDPMPTQESMREFYHSENFFRSRRTEDQLTGYRDYDAEETIRMRNAERRLNRLESMFPNGKRLRILKIACGYGALVKLARDKGHRAEGIEFSEVMVTGARERYGIDLISADFLKHDFRAATYDAVLLYGAINNFLRPMDVVRKVYSILKPGGIYSVNHVWPGSVPELLLGRRYWIYRPPIIGLYPRREFEARQIKLGFEVAKSEYDVQYVTCDKLFGYLQINPVLKLIETLRLSELAFTIPIPGYTMVYFRKPPRPPEPTR